MVKSQEKVIRVLKKKIGCSEPTFIIAEIGINHNGDMKTAKKLILEAKKSGADAIKLQTYITEQRVPKDHAVFDILKKCELSFKNQEELFNYSKEINIIPFSTPFDEESLMFLESIECSIYKIASFDTVNHNLLSQVAKLKRPVIISTGMTNFSELKEVLNIFKDIDIALMHCVSSYPLKNTDSDLSVIKTLLNLNAGPVGYSDHSLGIEVPVLAVAAGAKLIEKHFTLNRKEKGPDHSLSADPRTLSKLVQEIRKIEEIFGNPSLRLRKCEENARSFRRYTKKN